MEKINKSPLRPLLTLLFMSMVFINLAGQAPMPDELSKSPVLEQITFMEGRTKIFDNYRAIREDMYQKLMGNISDTLKISLTRINNLNKSVLLLKGRNDSLSTVLESTKANLDAAIQTKESFRFLGKDINKTTYNSILWLSIAGLVVILAIGFLTFRRNLIVTRHTEKEIKDLKDEFLTYKKTAREAREKMSMDHFNELKKLRGG